MKPYVRSFGFLLVVFSAGCWNWAHPRMDCSVRSVAPSESKVSQDIQKEIEEKEIAQDAQRAQQVFDSFGGICDGFDYPAARYARATGLSPRLVAADIIVESGCKPSVVSNAGAVGLMQIDCAHTWRRYSRHELTDPDRNIEVGTKILAGYIHETGSTREGLRHYFGVTEGSTASDEYADRVLAVARRK